MEARQHGRRPEHGPRPGAASPPPHASLCDHLAPALSLLLSPGRQCEAGQEGIQQVSGENNKNSICLIKKITTYHYSVHVSIWEDLPWPQKSLVIHPALTTHCSEI